MSHNAFTIREPIEPQETSPMQPEMSVLGIAIAQRVFHAVGMEERGKIVLRKRLSRHDLMPLLAKLPAGRIGMEAWGGAHDWARRFRAQGHEVKLMAPQFVKPYVTSHKNDSRDAEAIAEAVTRPTRRLVRIKDVDQQDLQALHRVRERLIGEQTALINEGHGWMEGVAKVLIMV
jgi:transposase